MKMDLMKKKKKKGFTLIELIIVVAIIGILAMIAVPKFGNLTGSAKDTTEIANAKIIGNATSLLIASDKLKVGTVGKGVYAAGTAFEIVMPGEVKKGGAGADKEDLVTGPPTTPGHTVAMELGKVPKTKLDANFQVVVDMDGNVKVYNSTPSASTLVYPK